jgi:hypothetical protein
MIYFKEIASPVQVYIKIVWSKRPKWGHVMLDCYKF